MDNRQSLLDIVEQQFRDFQQSTKDTAANYQGLIRAVKKDRANYHVVVRTLWEDKGEQDVVWSTNGSLDAALRAADTKFSEINNRYDNQRKYSVSVASGAIQIVVPPSAYEQYVVQLNQEREHLSPKNL